MNASVRALRAEWTKLRSVRSTGFALVAMAALLLLLTLVSASGSRTGYDGPTEFDSLTFAHRTATTADGTYTARVSGQRGGEPWAKAGLLLKDGTTSGSSYAALMVTPGHGLRMMTDGTHELTGGGDVRAPVWLRLTRVGARVTGAHSADGRSWHTLGTLPVAHLPATGARAGVFVASPQHTVERRTGPTMVAAHPVPTTGRATFDHVTMPVRGGWTRTDVVQPRPKDQPPLERAAPGTLHRSASGALTVTGSGDLGGLGMAGAGEGPGVDLVAQALESGTRLAALAVIALGVLFVTSEYRTGTVRTTFTASPRRGRVLAAKAVVLGAAVFAVALPATVAAFLLARPYQRANGFRPPLFTTPSLTDPASVRAVVGSAAFLALIAVLGLGVGALLRRTVPAIVLMFVAVVVLPIVASTTSITFGDVVGSATPAAGLAIQQTRRLIDDPTTPWAGFGVLCLYVVAVLAAARLRLVRRDV
ncbi:ABC transporter permease subunit [Streptomyces sp. NPDC088785]|uniref:ABC transporter permease subunit n=1 Tax=Streptomyces sp. NPDC088785 TaxID=3365897 RepID=UPI00382ECCE7